MLAGRQLPSLHCSRSTSRCSSYRPISARRSCPFWPASISARRTTCRGAGSGLGKRSSRREDSNAAPSSGPMVSRMITTSIREAETLQELDDILDDWRGSFSAISTAAAFTRAAKIAHKRPAAAAGLLNRLAAEWDSVLPDAGPQALANVMWASGKLQYSKTELWSSALPAFVKQLQQGKAENACLDIANVVHGLANISLANKGEVPGVHRSEGTAAVCQMLECMRLLVTHPLLVGVEPQNISNTLWACAKLRINPGDAALNSLVQAMSRPAMLEAAVTQNISNTLWAASELRQDCSWQPQLGQRVWQQLLGEAQLTLIAEKGQPQEISNVLLALAFLSEPTAAGPVIGRDFAQQCAVELLQGKVARQVSAWAPQAVANSMSSCAKLGVLDVAFCDRAAAAAAGWLPAAGVIVMEQVAWACAKLQFKHEQLIAGLVRRTKEVALQKQQHVKKQSLKRDTLKVVIGVVHAIAMLDMQHLAGDAKELIASSGVTPATNMGPLASMLWDVHAWLVQHQLLDGQGLAGLLSEQQLGEGRAASAAYYAQEEQRQRQLE